MGALEGFGGSRIGGHVTRTVKYVYDLVLQAKEEAVLQGKFERKIEIRRCCGMQKNVEKTKVMGISRQPSPEKVMMDQKHPENVEYFNYFGSMITNDARCAWKIKSMIVMEKAAFDKKEESFHQQIGLKYEENTSKVLRWEYSLLWS
jgi:hypothetical protein